MKEKYKTYKATKFEKACSKTIPYIIPFISKSKRNKIRDYFKYRFRKRELKDLCQCLLDTSKNNDIMKHNINLTDDEYSWEVIIIPYKIIR